MSRPTDTFRGARMAWHIAHDHISQPDLFGGVIPIPFWEQIRQAASDQLDESVALERALLESGHAR